MRKKFRNNWKITRKYFENKSELIRKTMNYFGNKTSEIIRKQFGNNWEQIGNHLEISQKQFGDNSEIFRNSLGNTSKIIRT